MTVSSSKNGAIALLCGSLLNKGTTTLHHVPAIREVDRLIEVLSSIGVSVERRGKSVVVNPPPRLQLGRIDYSSAVRTRIVLLLLGTLIHHQKKFLLPQPGGCRLGKRTVSPHLFALENFGVGIKTQRKYFAVTARKLRPADFALYESGDTVTENALLAAALIPGKTVLRFASANYQVQELCYFLQELGIGIEGVGTTTLTVRGRKTIQRNIQYSLSEDPIEAMFFVALAATTASSLIIKRCPIDFLRLELLKLEKMGFSYSIVKQCVSRNKKTNLVDIRTRPSSLRALDDKISARPYPGLNIDNLPYFVPIATQAKGLTLIHDWVYENRAIYYTELNRLGAKVMLADPHRVYVEGPTKLAGAEIICPPALRPSTNILIGMLAARGQSRLRNIYAIERGYEHLARRLRDIGAAIEEKSDK